MNAPAAANRPTFSAFTHDLHVHLYGCVDASTVHGLGLARWQSRESALVWYAAEFEKAHGRVPRWREYWTTSQGRDLLASDYEITKKTNFPQFQACFNLLIALFPLDPTDRTVLEGVLRCDRAAGIRYAEYRTILPVAFGDQPLDVYLQSHCQVLGEFTDSKFVPRVAFSLPRDPEAATIAYQRLRLWMDHHSELAPSIVGIDFCGFEEADPALSKFDLFRQVRHDNQRAVNPLAILLHVGETWETLSPLSALRRVWEAAFSGAHRLGHATIAGIGPDGLRGRTFQNQRLEWERDLQWLNRIATSDAPGLSVAGLAALIDGVHMQGQQWNQQGQGTLFQATETYLSVFMHLQDLVLRDLVESQVVIESCPTSNLFLSGLEPPNSHPIKRFVTGGVRTVIGRDDPGIFGSTFVTEETFCRDVAGLTDTQIAQLASQAVACQSAVSPARC